MKLTVKDEKIRLDRFLSENIPNSSRNEIQRIISEDKVRVNKKIVSVKSFKIKQGDIIETEDIVPKEYHIKAEPIDIDIVYQDDNYAVINKPAGLITHPAGRFVTNTLVNALLYHLDNLSGIGGVIRPGIVHRLDKDTSGLMVVAKNDNTHRKLSEMIKDHTVERTYIAVVDGVINEDEGNIIAPIGRDPSNRLRRKVISGGQEAETLFKIIEKYKRASYAEIRLKTGRTHQIRAHFKYIKHPVTGDKTYGSLINIIKRPALHSHKLRFLDPFTNKRMEFKAEIPDDIKKLMDALKNE